MTDHSLDRQALDATLLLVDDSTTNLQVLRESLSGIGYKLLIAKSGPAALAAARKALPDLILLDIMMPDMDGYEVCRRLKADDTTRRIPVIFLTALAGIDDEAKGLALGAVDYIAKPIFPELVRVRVRNHLELKRYQDELQAEVRRQTRDLALTQAVMIESLATLAEYRDPETGGHIKRTQNYVKALAVRLKTHPRFRHELTDDAIDLLYLSAPLHDIGKVGVRDDVLLKAGRLTDDEFQEMKRHTQYGHDALYHTEQKLKKSAFLRYAREIAYTHQEKWDGSGYPQGLKGEAIPISGRLMALADVYDALISKRIYKPPFTHEKAVDIIREGRGTHFDPDIVEAFLDIEETFRNIALTFADHDEEREALGGDRSPGDDSCRITSVLVAEDNEINRSIMKSQLVAMGLEVHTAANGREALDILNQRAVDLVLTDIDMPVMSGYEMVAALRQMTVAGGRSTPVIAITASDFDMNEASARTAGFDDFMLKPLDTELLMKKLCVVFGRSPFAMKPDSDSGEAAP